MSITFEGNTKDLRNFSVKQAKKPDTAYDSYVKAMALCVNNMHKESVKYFLSAIFAKRNNPESYLGLGIAQRNLGEYEKSVSNLKKAMELDDNNSKIPLELGITYLHAGEIEDAITNFQYSIMLDKTNYNAQLQLGIAHELIEEYELALMIYQKIIEEDKSFITAYNHKAALLIDLEMFEEAGQVFKSILKMNSRYDKAYLGLGIIYEKLNKKGLSLRYYRKYLKLKPHSHHFNSLMARISKIKSGSPFGKENKTSLKVIEKVI